jgi:AcrR family transcriptional regulator
MAAPRTSRARDELLHAALDTFVERTWAEVHLEDIAARAGVDVAELRRSFPGLEDQ